jgi:hypothetical protein
MHEMILIEIIGTPAEHSRGRHNPRVVKRKMSNFPTKARARAMAVLTDPARCCYPFVSAAILMANHDPLPGALL